MFDSRIFKEDFKKSTYNGNMGPLDAEWVWIQSKNLFYLNFKLHEKWYSKNIRNNERSLFYIFLSFKCITVCIHLEKSFLNVCFLNVISLMFAGDDEADISCCTYDHQLLAPTDQHPECAAIAVPSTDPLNSQYKIRCMNFVRSKTGVRNNCSLAEARDQLNEVSAYIDGGWAIGGQ